MMGQGNAPPSIPRLARKHQRQTATRGWPLGTTKSGSFPISGPFFDFLLFCDEQISPLIRSAKMVIHHGAPDSAADKVAWTGRLSRGGFSSHQRKRVLHRVAPPLFITFPSRSYRPRPPTSRRSRRMGGAVFVHCWLVRSGWTVEVGCIDVGEFMAKAPVRCDG